MTAEREIGGCRCGLQTGEVRPGNSQALLLRHHLDVGAAVTHVERIPTIAVGGRLVRRLPGLGISLEVQQLCFAQALRRVADGVQLDRQEQSKSRAEEDEPLRCAHG
jgi:hypothetical protein